MKSSVKYGLALWLGANLFSIGCVSSKYQVASALDAQPRLMNVKLDGGPVMSRLDAVIIYQGPGSWKKAAYWDEFMVTFTNPGDEPLTLTTAALVDYAGTLEPAGTDPWQLEKASRDERARYTQAGVSFVLNTLGYVAYTSSAVGAGIVVGAATTSTWSGAAAGATLGLAAVPVTALVILVNNQKHRHLIEGEFSRRRLALPLTLAAGETRSGSLFFPMTVSPPSLRLAWVRGPDDGISLLPLPMLAGLHLKAPSAPDPVKP